MFSVYPENFRHQRRKNPLVRPHPSTVVCLILPAAQSFQGCQACDAGFFAPANTVNDKCQKCAQGAIAGNSKLMCCYVLSVTLCSSVNIVLPCQLVRDRLNASHVTTTPLPHLIALGADAMPATTRQEYALGVWKHHLTQDCIRMLPLVPKQSSCRVKSVLQELTVPLTPHS